MKKSKFLKNSKDLLSRSFNSSKCKIALKLAGSRVKLLRNKKEAEVKQMKREIAQLLESGKNQTARVRVEHVVKEEKMMSAYDLIGIYCELSVARMQIIESQKICPVDMKEAIASLLFASPRCGDVPELEDVKKQFTEKYGKDFASAAVDLRPQSGVCRLLVEKLSATAPDGQTKVKILSAIASEHNVKWDPGSFEEKESIPITDLLKGPRTFEETKFPVEPPHAENLVTRASQSKHRMHHSPSNLSQPDYISSLGTENQASQTSGVNRAFHHEENGPALREERAQLFRGDSNATPRDRWRWNLEFTDATAAAQAAAESAELASMAARAAAELSNRDKFMRQYSNESHKSDSHFSEHGGPKTYVNSKMERENSFEEPRNRSFIGNTGLQSGRVHGIQPDNQKAGGRFNDNSCGSMKEFSQSTSLNSKASVYEDNSLDHDVPDAYSYSPRKPFPDVSRGEMNMQRQSFKYTHSRPETHDNVRENNRIRKQPNSHSQSGISDDMNTFANYDEQPAALELRNTWMESNHIGKSSPDDRTGLDLRKLTGGFRHKGYNPPILKNQNDTLSRPTVPASSESPGVSKTYEHNISEKMRNSHFLSDRESSEEEESITKRSSGQKLKKYTPRTGNESNIKPSLASSKSSFDSDNTDSDEDAPMEFLTGLRHRKNGISQRTKAPSSGSGKSSYSKMYLSSDALDSDGQMYQKPGTTTPETPKAYESWRSSTRMNNYEQPTSAKVALKPVKPNLWGSPEPYSSGEARLGSDSETRQQYQGLRKNSSHLGHSEQPTSANSNLWETPNRHNSEKENPSTVQESKKTWNPSAREELPSACMKTDASVTASSDNVVKPSATLNKTNSNNQRPSHVHPKLPDYDTLVQALRKNRS